MAEIIDGKRIAREIRREVAGKTAELKARGICPGLAVILVGEDPASQVYVRNKERACVEVGFRSLVIRHPSEVSQRALLEEVARLNADPEIHGILVQLPLPGHIDERTVLAAISPDKDVDGFHACNMGALVLGEDAPVSCTPMGCVELLRRSGAKMDGAHAVIVGRSNIVGKPLALLLLRENCTVTVCHSHTRNLPGITRQADILVAAVGRPRFITADMVKPGATVIDVGINRLPDGTLTGDVDFAGVEPLTGAITPVPGGVGPMTIAMLMKNTLKQAGKHG
ncbi:MAG: bifunctional methylenetetrahydrofolate dehydrogenase/methenyltetrahydrofolate cyclohydrolase FolD [Clostridia bacterium]|nr:bifunctional methylenetetrahydrofolate dehydrogenase/methenyltetrahydrofolate cyclohydrolase FolD [Clostridia bacterium]